MKRDLAGLAKKKYDILVVGGGIHGICVARDAALRGYRVALLERSDFGSQTSHSSLKTVHGGMRYIQHLDFRRMRQSVRERRAWLKIAPHLVHPLKFVMHTRGHVTRGPEALRVATIVHEMVGYDRNKGVRPERHLPPAEIVGRVLANELIPGLEDCGHNGGAIWYDGQMLDADRLMIECLESAVTAGATIANYAEVSGLLLERDRVNGVAVTDKLSGENFDVGAAVIINAAGPWVDRVLSSSSSHAQVPPLHPHNFNMNLVTRRIVADHAIGVKSNRKSDSIVDSDGRLFFITPWRNVSVIGTTHEAFEGDPDDFAVSESKIEEFLAEVNDAYPPAALTRQDVNYCYWGMTPGETGLHGSEALRARHGHLVDHRHKSGLAGLVTIVGVKWTTARLVAEQALDLAEQQLPGVSRACATQQEFLPGAAGSITDELLAQDISAALPQAIDAQEISDLAVEYGVRWRKVVALAPGESDLRAIDLFAARVRFAIENEMAVTLDDVLSRRTSLLQRGLLTQEQVNLCLDIMAAAMGWNDARRSEELERFERQKAKMHARILP